MDLYLSRKPTEKKNLQLLAMVCIFVASKFHEVEAISIAELQTLAEGGYTVDAIQSLELDLLRTLEWNMAPITVRFSFSFYLFISHIIIILYVNKLTFFFITHRLSF